ncbi:MAG: class B sortase, partial [Parafannyhessea umbonata]|nr:class B sortase [Parafannyhessea umbonata]
ANVQVSEDNNGAPKIDFAALEAVNDDIVGWVDVVGTSMSFPVYQGKTNNTYLRTSATGEYSVGGQVFLDCKNTKPGMVDAQSLIYGHHLNDGQMFAPLDDLKEQGNFDKVKTVWYVDRNNKAWELEPLLLYIIKSDYDDDLRTFTFASNDEFHAYLNKMLAKAVAKRSDAQQVIGGTSHVLTLVTCNYDFGHGRAVMLCVPKSEAAAATGAQAQDASTSGATSGTTNGS